MPPQATVGGVFASRRDMLKGSLGVSAATVLFGATALSAGRAAAETATTSASFAELAAGVDARHHLADGYESDVLLRWGDPLFADSPDFDPAKQSAEAQARQFGYNNDYVGYIPIDGSAEHGLLVVNHEYTNPHLMFPGIVSIVEKEGKKAAEVARHLDTMTITSQRIAKAVSA